VRHVRKELKSLRYEIQRQKGHLNALDRQLARVHGKKIRYAAPDSKTDKQRLREEWGIDSSSLESPNTLKVLRRSQARDIQKMQDRAAYLQHRLDTQLPISPWGVAFLLVKIWIEKRQSRRPPPQQVRRSRPPQHRHDRRRKLYKPREDV